MDILTEGEYLEKYPVINDLVTGYCNDYGVDLSKYYFSEFTTWEHDKDITYYTVYYGSKVDENITFGITIGQEIYEINFEEFKISLD